MAKAPQKTKAQKLAAATASRAKKKKWSKNKQGTSSENQCFITAEQLAACRKSVVKDTVITTNSLSNKYRVSLSVSRRILRQLEQDGLIRPVVKNGNLLLYTKIIPTAETTR